MSWDTGKLGELCDVRDGTHDSPKYHDEGIPLVTSKNLVNGSIDFSTASLITELDHSAISKRSKVDNGDILYAMIGTVGNPVIVDTDIEFSIKNVGLIKFKDDSKIYNRFLIFALSSDFVKRQILRESKGGTQKFVSLKVLRNLEIPLPPLSVQKQIAAVLEKADTLRNQCQEMEQELNTLAQSVFLDMFGDPVTNPKGLEMISLGECAETLAGYAFKSKDYSENHKDIRLCRGINIMPGELSWKDAAYWDINTTDGLDKFWMKEGDVVIAMDRPWISTGFKIAQLTQEDLPSLLLQRVMRIRGKDKLENNYFYHCLNQQAFLQHSHITETTVPHISPKDIKTYQIFKLDREQLERFDNRISTINKLLIDNKAMQNRLSDNFNSLMQRAFTGELQLKDVA